LPRLNLATAPVEASVGHRGRIEQLDGLRAVAILAVIVHHCMRVPLLWVGVDIFFVLSGFLITGILIRRKQKRSGYYSGFYFRRLFRIQPAYLISIILYGTFFTWRLFRPWPYYAFFGMNIHPLIHAWPFGLPVWSLAVEEQFYLLWPTFVLLLSEKNLLRLSIGVVLFTPLLRALCAPLFPNSGYIYMLTPFRADLLCAGAAFAIIWARRTPAFEAHCRRRAWIGVLLGFGVLAGLNAFVVFRIASNTRWSNGIDYSLSLIGATSLLAWSLAGRGVLYRILTLKPVRYIGQISYMMYLVHEMIEIRLLRYMPQPATLIPTLAITIAFATVTWYLLERPLINFAAHNSFESLGRMLTGRHRRPAPEAD
jgi:peptidoglycan/LPS O-acetylase OafA/YrhL